ncbi:MetQ/NlpA family ABC transporter substrate-binding protein [Bacteroides faecichinchillae]|uniref:ABC transporter substrate-binding protein n=1 Tax=Bacteroides faecichinchillae TaxID=871325 RepID=UPI00351372F7
MKKLILVFCILLSFLSSCQRKKGESFFLPSSELQPLTLGMMPTLEGLPYYIAQKQGIYDSLGLNLTIFPFYSANDRDAAFQAHQVDGIITDYSSAVILQANHHTNLRLIQKNDSYFCFIVSKESNINQLKQLKEKNIAVSRNTIIEYATDLLLDKAGIKSSEINKPEIGQIPLRLQMLDFKQLDASFLPDPAASLAMDNGHRSLVSTRELDIDFTVTAFSLKALNEKRREIKLLITGYNLGVGYIKTHPQKEWEQVLVEIGVPKNLTGLIALPAYKKATRPSPEAIEKAVNWLKANHRIPKSYRENNLIDTTYIHSEPTIM